MPLTREELIELVLPFVGQVKDSDLDDLMITYDGTERRVIDELDGLEASARTTVSLDSKILVTGARWALSSDVDPGTL